MKTAISVPDDVFEAGERYAGRRGMTRSQLYATALASFLARHRDEEITRALDAVYGSEASEPDAVLTELQRRSLGGERW